MAGLQENGEPINYRGILDFVEELDRDDFPAAAAELLKRQTESPTVSGRELLSRLLKRWAEFDRPDAVDWIMRMPAGDDRRQAVADAAGIWATKDFAGAAAWARQLPNEAERQRARESVALQISPLEPVESLKLAGTLPAGPARDDIVMRAASAWAGTAPAEASAWALQIPDQALRQRVISVIAMTWGDHDPRSAARMAVESIQPGDLQDRTVFGIVQRWGLNDLPAATAWVNRFPEGALRRAALATLDAYAKRDQPLSEP